MQEISKFSNHFLKEKKTVDKSCFVRTHQPNKGIFCTQWTTGTQKATEDGSMEVGYHVHSSTYREEGGYHRRTSLTYNFITTCVTDSLYCRNCKSGITFKSSISGSEIKLAQDDHAHTFLTALDGMSLTAYTFHV